MRRDGDTEQTAPGVQDRTPGRLRSWLAARARRDARPHDPVSPFGVDDGVVDVGARRRRPSWVHPALAASVVVRDHVSVRDDG
jgi:hypothetical protein